MRNASTMDASRVKIFFLLLTMQYALAKLPKSLPKTVIKRLSSSSGNYLFFCTQYDAMKIWPEVVGSNVSVNIKVLKGNLENEIAINENQPQKIGVFLDLSCDAGYTKLQKSLTFFNASYLWVLWSDNVEKTIEALKPSRLENDSEVVLFTIANDTEDSVKSTRISRLHYSLNFTLTDDNDEKPVTRINYNGFQLPAVLLLAEMKDEFTSIEKLMDRSFKPTNDLPRRYTFTLMKHMAEYYNYSLKYILTDSWGYPQPNKSWSGMIGLLQKGEAEIGLAAVKYVHSRYEVIDYLTSVDWGRCIFVFLQPKRFGTYKALFLPLSLTTWLALGAVAVLSIVAFRLFVFHDKTSAHNDGWGGSALLVLAAISNQGIPDNSADTAARIGYLAILTVSFFVGIYYNTSILNSLILQAPNAIQNLEQLLDSDIRLGVLEHHYLRHDIASNDSLSTRIREKMYSHGPPHFFEIENGIEQVRKGRFALYIEVNDFYTTVGTTYSEAQICSVTEIEKVAPFQLGLIARHNTPFKEHFRVGLIMMRERGILSRNKKYWIPSKPDCHWKQDARALGNEPLFLGYVCLIVGFILSMIIFFIEKYYYQYQRNLSAKKRPRIPYLN